MFLRERALRSSGSNNPTLGPLRALAPMGLTLTTPWSCRLLPDGLGGADGLVAAALGMPFPALAAR